MSSPASPPSELDRICHDYIVNDAAGHPGPAELPRLPQIHLHLASTIRSATASPSNKLLKKGDIVNIDITVIKDGYHGDTSKMFFVGEASGGRQARVHGSATSACVIGIEMVRPGVRLGDIGHAIQEHAEANNCSIVREYCGHGIGREFHEEPQVLHYGTPAPAWCWRPA